MESYKVIVSGEISNEGAHETYIYTDLDAAVLKFGRIIGEVYETILREEGFIAQLQSVGFDMEDCTGWLNESFEILLSANGIEDNAHDTGSAVLFKNSRNDRLGAVVLLGWTE